MPWTEGMRDSIRKLNAIVEASRARMAELKPLPSEDSLDVRDRRILMAFSEAEAYEEAALREKQRLILEYREQVAAEIDRLEAEEA